MINYYGILGVSPTSSIKEIKAAYKKLAQMYHPDKEDGNSEKYVEVQKAYEILKDTIKRAALDRELLKGTLSEPERFLISEIGKVITSSPSEISFNFYNEINYLSKLKTDLKSILSRSNQSIVQMGSKLKQLQKRKDLYKNPEGKINLFNYCLDVAIETIERDMLDTEKFLDTLVDAIELLNEYEDISSSDTQDSDNKLLLGALYGNTLSD